MRAEKLVNIEELDMSLLVWGRARRREGEEAKGELQKIRDELRTGEFVRVSRSSERRGDK